MSTEQNKVSTQILIGQPANYPYELLESVKMFLKTKQSVSKAYVACINYSDRKVSSLIIGLDVNDDYKNIIIELEGFLNEKNIVTEPLGFVNINDVSFKKYFSKIEPFYKKSE